jgi:hypothetical protein
MVYVSAPACAATWYADSTVAGSGDGKSWETALKTIQEGIKLASNGDTVAVHEGTYLENIKLSGKNITLRGSDPLDPDVVKKTIIDGNHAGSVVTFEGTEDETCVLSGFTIRNGSTTGNGGGICGGTDASHTHATIRNNVVAGNSTTGGWPSGFGGGIGLCDGIIENNTVTGNSAAFGGGGVGFCNAIIRNNLITGNTALGYWGWGGGVGWCYGIVQNNVITRNTAAGSGADGGLGGGVYSCWNIANNEIRDNSATQAGGGIARCDVIQGNTITGNSGRKFGGGLYQCGHPGVIYGNSITGNSAEEGGGLYECGAILSNTVSGNSATEDGGGLAQCHGPIHNNLITGNSAQRGGGLAWCEGTTQNNTITNNSATGAKSVGGGLAFCYGAVRNCIVWGNTAEGSGNQTYESNTPSFSCIQDWTGGGLDNIGEDPVFVDGSGGDYHLQDGSPCIDRGVNYYWCARPQCDIEGNCRLVGGQVDMGCYEYGSSRDSDGDLLSDLDEATRGTDPLREDTDGDGLRDGLEVLRGSDPRVRTPPAVIVITPDGPTIQEVLCVAVTGDEIVVAPGTYRENLQFCGAEVILRGSNPQEPDVVASTIIDGGGLGPVVLFTGLETEASVLAGLTIQNGRAGSGAGVCGGLRGVPGWSRYSRAIIRNNRIRGNSATLYGGGGIAYVAGAIQGNTISENSAVGQESGGGGLYSCPYVIENNTISGNSARLSGGGAAYCDALIQHNRIMRNTT